MLYTYFLLSEKDNNLYIGSTNNLERRLEEHFSGQNKSTKGRMPLKLIYYKACLSKEKALAREKYFKSNFGRRFLRSRI